MSVEADNFKDIGNKLLNEKRFNEAIEAYTKAINLCADNHVYYSNRSAAYLSDGQHQNALKDAEITVKLKPDWPKGYSRLGAAYEMLEDFENAKTAYENGLKYDSNNAQLTQSLSDLKNRKRAQNNPFSNPATFAKLSTNPKTRDFLKDPDFLQKIQMLGSNPSAAANLLQDPRILTAMGVILGADVDMAEPNSDVRENHSNFDHGNNFSTNNNNTSTNNHTSKKHDSQFDSNNSTKASSQANKEKEFGNNFYKSKDFSSALKHYEKAIEFEPTNMLFYLNIAAVYFEEKNYDQCTKFCEKAIEVGRENRSDFKNIAKAFTRMANVQLKLENYPEAISLFKKSLSEFRDADILKKLSEVERTHKDILKKAYINPEIAQQEKDKGNEFFKEGKYPDAIKHYTEAINRNPEDAKVYSNRAACYMKLIDCNRCLHDCEECIRLDPNFVKGYLRKGACLLLMREPQKAAIAYEKALDCEPNNEEAKEGINKCTNQLMDLSPEEQRDGALNDPEIQSILSDPAMQVILQQMQKDPKAAMEHFRDPIISRKIQKLISCGVIQTR